MVARASAQPAVVLTASPGERASVMHDFCLTLPYGLLVALGGVMGFLLKGSIPSLAAGGGSGLALMLLGVGSLKTWQKGTKGASAPFTLASARVAGMLTFVMGKRFLASGAIFPAGVIATLSGVMLLFYVYNLLAGGNPLPKKSA